MLQEPSHLLLVPLVKLDQNTEMYVLFMRTACVWVFQPSFQHLFKLCPSGWAETHLIWAAPVWCCCCYPERCCQQSEEPGVQTPSPLSSTTSLALSRGSDGSRRRHRRHLIRCCLLYCFRRADEGLMLKDSSPGSLPVWQQLRPERADFSRSSRRSAQTCLLMEKDRDRGAWRHNSTQQLW